MTDNFFNKIYLNVLSKYNFSISDEFFFEELTNYNSSMQGKWSAEYWKIREKYIEDNNIQQDYRVYPKHFLNKDDMNRFVKMIREEFPSVEDDWDITNNAKVIAELLDLSKNETIILNLAIKAHNLNYCDNAIFKQFDFASESSNIPSFYSKLFNIPQHEITEVLNGFLLKSGFLVENKDIRCLFKVNEDLAAIFVNKNITIDKIEEILFPNNINTELTVESYPHLTKEIEKTERIINKAIEDNSRGINVLLWGLPGTGKTELSLVLAKKHNWNLKIVGDISDSDNTEKSRTQRLTSLKIAMKLYGRNNTASNTVILFDEMEDLFKNDSADFSKAFINRIVETTKIPIIWTTNDLEKLGQAMLRRMVYNIGFSVPPIKARRKIWNGYIQKYNLEIDPEVVENLAMHYDLVPALIGNAAKITKMSGLDVNEIPDVLSSLDTLMNFGYKRKFPSLVDNKKDLYNIDFVNANLDMNVVTQRLLNAKPNFSICIFGPPGTGKSAYGRYLAKQMNKRVLFKRASDLVSMWLGETEKNISAAFEQAREDEMLFIIDEGDSFLRSRQGADHSWEVSQTNEMLSQMEDHPEPFVITTNLIDSLDDAALSRFTFKIKFDFMKPQQAFNMFKAYFGMEPPTDIYKNDILAGRDFANVKKKVDILGITDSMEIYKLLTEETDIKPQNVKKIGFQK